MAIKFETNDDGDVHDRIDLRTGLEIVVIADSTDRDISVQLYGAGGIIISLGSIKPAMARRLAQLLRAAASSAMRDRCDSRMPICAVSMGCLCAGHARGNDAEAPCDTSEQP